MNANEAPPAVMLARVCSFIEDQPLCNDPLEAAKFIQLVTTVRSMSPFPFFTRNTDFITFLEGRGGPQDLYPMLVGILGPDNPLLFTPVTIPADKRAVVTNSFITAAQILTIESCGIRPQQPGSHPRRGELPRPLDAAPAERRPDAVARDFHHYRID